MKWRHQRSPLVRVFHALILALVVGVASYYIQTPYVLNAPGPALKTGALVHIAGTRTYPSSGSFILPTVLAEPANLFYCVYALLDPAARLLPRADAGPEQDGRLQMSLSQSLATIVALEHLPDLDPSRVKGLSVLQLLPGSPNQQRLRVGDVLCRLNGKELHHIRDLVEQTQSQRPGSVLMAEIERDGLRRAVALEIWLHGGRKMIGAVLVPALTEADSEIQVKIETQHVSGASGGLVFCLEILDQLLPEDLAGGRCIAATGTLDRQGRVGPIEGVAFKLVSAQRAGAQVFFCPQENLAELQPLSSDLEVHGVTSLGQALEILRSSNRTGH